MNPHFSASRDRRAIPRSAYARLDSIEEMTNGTMVAAFDAVSCASADDLVFSLSSEEWASVWRGSFSGSSGAINALTAFDRLELLHIEVPMEDPDIWRDKDLASGRWIRLELGPSQEADGLAATAYTSLFSEPESIGLRLVDDVAGATAFQLNSALSMENWPIAQLQSIAGHFQDAELDRWHAFDVGQGSANGLLGYGPVTLFHDLGCGAYRNAKTAPLNTVVCHSQRAPIILSHWDTDHWAGARRFAPLGNPDVFLDRTWIAPSDPTVGPSHILFAASILISGGTLHVLPAGPWATPWIYTSHNKSLRLIRGNGPDRNGTGVALEVRNRHVGRWLLPGDVCYDFLQPYLYPTYVAIAVPHHGANGGAAPVIPAPASPYSRLVYSFGHDNSYGHPTLNCIASHVAQGWQHGIWSGTTQAAAPLVVSARATGCNAPGPNHLGGVLVGWSTAPIPPGLPCGGICNAAAMQN